MPKTTPPAGDQPAPRVRRRRADPSTPPGDTPPPTDSPEPAAGEPTPEPRRVGEHTSRDRAPGGDIGPFAGVQVVRVRVWWVRATTRGVVGKTIGYIDDHGVESHSAQIVGIEDDGRALVTDEVTRYLLPEAAPPEPRIKGGVTYPDRLREIHDAGGDGPALGDRVDVRRLGEHIKTSRKDVRVPLTEAELEELREEYITTDAERAAHETYSLAVKKRLKLDGDQIDARKAAIAETLSERARDVRMRLDVYVDLDRRITSYVDPMTGRLVETATSTSEEHRLAEKARQVPIPGTEEAEGEDDEGGDEGTPSVRGGVILLKCAVPKKQSLQVIGMLRTMTGLGLVDCKAMAANASAVTPTRIDLLAEVDRTAALDKLRALGLEVVEGETAPPDALAVQGRPQLHLTGTADASQMGKVAQLIWARLADNDAVSTGDILGRVQRARRGAPLVLVHDIGVSDEAWPPDGALCIAPHHGLPRLLADLMKEGADVDLEGQL